MDVWNPMNWFFYVPLLVLSTVSLAIILERAVFGLKIPLLQEKPFQDLLLALRNKNLLPVAEVVKNSPSHEAALVREFLQIRKNPHSQVELQVELRAREMVLQREARLDLLSSLSGIATLLGLFGTVTGMIWSFGAMSAAGRADPAVLSGGIAQALITTAAGLAIALPSLTASSVFRFFVRTLATRLEFLAEEMLAILSKREKVDDA